MPLTDTQCKNAKPKPDGKANKLSNGEGMYLLVNTTGKYWRMDYRFDGRRLTLALGVYPDVPLTKAREKRGEARRRIADGIDPGVKRKAERVSKANCFEAIAREWHEMMQPTWADSHAVRVIRRLWIA